MSSRRTSKSSKRKSDSRKSRSDSRDRSPSPASSTKSPETEVDVSPRDQPSPVRRSSRDRRPSTDTQIDSVRRDSSAPLSVPLPPPPPPPKTSAVMKKSMTLKVKPRGVKDAEPPTVLESQDEILAFFSSESSGSPAAEPKIPAILQQMLDREKEHQKSQKEAAAAVLQDFKSVGAFVRKIGDPNATDNPVTKDLTQMRDNASGGKNATQPLVRPATFVKSDIPINLTDAGGLIKDSSGFVFRAETQIAPSTKEHSESVRLGNILRDQTDLSPDDWSGVIRHAVEEKGGRSFDDVKDLSLKMQELDDRRLGKIPDLSGKEMLVELFTFALETIRQPGDGKITAEWFQQILRAYSFPHPETKAWQPLPPYIQEGLINKILVTIEDKNTNEFSSVMSSLVKEVTQRKVREHSIYTQNTVGHSTYFDQFQPAARYYLSTEARKKRAAKPKSERFYDGSSFRTTEALMIPSDQDVGGVYVNTNSSQSLLQALYIANEFFVQTERVLPLFTYSTKEGLQPLTLAAAFDLMRDRLKKEQNPDEAAEVENPTVNRLQTALGRDLTPDEIDGTKDFQADDVKALADDPTIEPDEFDPVFKNLADLIQQKRLTKTSTTAKDTASGQDVHQSLIQRVLKKDVSLAKEIKIEPLTPEQIQALAAHKAIRTDKLLPELSQLASLITRKRLELFTVKDVEGKTKTKLPQSPPKQRSPQDPMDWSGASGKRKSDGRPSPSDISALTPPGGTVKPSSKASDRSPERSAAKVPFDGINMSYQYEDLDMWKVLTLNFPDGDPHGVEVMAPVDNILYPGQLDIPGQLQTILQAQQDNRPQTTKLVIPYNLGNYHWVGIYVEKQPDGSVTVTYMDPLRDLADVLPQVQKEIEAVYGAENVTFDNTRSYLTQKDKTSCGPITIHNLTALARGQDPTTPSENARSLRRLHVQQIMDDDSTSDFEHRQLHNLRTVTSKFNMRAYLEKNRVAAPASPEKGKPNPGRTVKDRVRRIVASEKTPEKTSEQTPEKTSEKTSEKTTDDVDLITPFDDTPSPSSEDPEASSKKASLANRLMGTKPEKLKQLLHFSKPSPFLKGRRRQTRDILRSLFDTLDCAFDGAISTKNSLYDLRESTLQEWKQHLDKAMLGDGQALFNLLSSPNPIGSVLLQNPKALHRLVQRLPDTEASSDMMAQLQGILRKQGDPEMPLTPSVEKVFQQKTTKIIDVLFQRYTADSADPRGVLIKTLFDDLGCSRNELLFTQTALFLLKDKELKRLKVRLDNLVSGNQSATQDLFDIISGDNPIGRLLLKNPDTFRSIIETFPNTSQTLDDIEKIETFLVKVQDAAFKTHIESEVFLTTPIHEVCYKEKTEILEDLIEQEIAQTEAPGLAVLEAMGKNHYWKILIDGQVHDKDNKHFYDRSKGFMSSMMKGLFHIVENIDRPLDTDFVKGLHTAATQLVTTESVLPPNYPMSSQNFQEHGLKRSPNAWGVTKRYTEAGMTELEALRREIDGQVNGGYFSEDEMRFAKRDASRVMQWKAGKSATGLQDTVEMLMNYVITKAYTQIAKANTPDDVIGAIVDCCRGLGIIHPFKDANGRLLMLLVLNKLLMEQGLPPTTLDDQGLMIGQSKTELIQLIKEGQSKMVKLAKGEIAAYDADDEGDN